MPDTRAFYCAVQRERGFGRSDLRYQSYVLTRVIKSGTVKAKAQGRPGSTLYYLLKIDYSTVAARSKSLLPLTDGIMEHDFK